jgi:hypothetical protein
VPTQWPKPRRLVVAAVNGGTTAASLILQAQEFLSAASETDAAFGTSAANFNNKAEVASHYTLTNETAALGTATLADVTSDDDTVTSAKASLDAAPAAAAEAFSLTKGLDSKTTGAGDDTFNSANTATVTLNSGDILDGGDGTDTLSVSNTVAAATLGTGVTTTNIEGLSVNAVANTTVDTSLMTGITDVYNNGSLGTLSVTNLKAIPNVHLTSTAADTTVGFASAATVASTADAMTVALNAASVTGSANLTADGIETFNVIASGVSGSATQSQTLTSSSARSVATTGDASTNITVNLAGAGATAATAGSYTGNDATNRVNLTADAADILTVDLKGGDDTYTASSIGAKHTITGGDGTDTLKLTQAVATAASTKATVSGWETLNVSDGGTGTIDMDAFSGVEKVVYDAGLAAATTVDDAVTGIEVEVDVTAAASNLTVDLKTDGAADTIHITLDAIGAGDAIGVINASDAETLNISVDDDTLTATGTIAISSITLGDATTLNISGDAATTVSGATNPTTAVLGTVNAGSMTDNLTISGLNLKSSGGAVTLGSGNDSYTMGTADGADTIDISAGGKDTIVYTALGQSDAAGMDVITGFTSGSDDIDLTALGVTTTTLFGGVGANKTAAEALLGATAAPIAVYQADDQILWVDVSGDNALGAGDFRVQLSGVSTIAATDLKLAASGATTAATAASAVLSTALATNMSAKATNEADTISSTTAFSVGSTFDGAQGADTITFSLTAGGVATVDLDDAAGDIENIETVVLGTGVTQVNLLAADIKGNTGGEIAALTGTSATSQTLLVNTGDVVLSSLTNTNIEVISANDSGGAGITVTIDTANLTDVDRLVLDDGNAGGADTLTLAGGNYDFSAIDLDFDDAGVANVLTIDTVDAKGGTITLDDADVDNVGVITGEATADVITTIAATGDLDLSAMAVTEIDTFTIAGANKTLTIDGDDATALAAAEASVGVTITGSGTSNVTFAVGGGAAALSLADFTITGVDLVNVAAAAAAVDLDLDANSIAGTFTLTGSAGDDTDLTFTEDADYSSMTITAGGFDEITLDEAADVTLSEKAFAGTSTIASILGTAGGVTETLTVTMSTAGTMDMNALATITNAKLTINGTSGNDTIDLGLAGTATDAAMDDATVVLTTGGADTINIDNDAHAADATGLTVTDFTGGTGAGADKLSITNSQNSLPLTFQSITAAASTIATSANAAIEITVAVGTVTDFTATGAGAAVEALIADALNVTTANGTSIVAIYGSGASAGSAAIYEVVDGSAGDLVAGDITVELLAVLSGVTADSLGSGNFI